MEERVILVDQDDKPVGTMEKMEAHLSGSLHRAFSVFIFNSNGQLLLQQRALDKYHSPGLWTNTCCSHPRPGEDTMAAAGRRLYEEMGMRCNLTYGFHFIYKADFDNQLTEHEYDHVFFGHSDVLPLPDPAEVAAFKYVDLQDLEHDLSINSDNYSAWLKICFRKMMDYKLKLYGFLDN